ncbi:MAG: LytTR family DNA-binding domain-containing protein [Peptococcaceae bacterium]|nr:LytTR family DNA-binding domain-containing protein [Peptococcaceae bacterium]
MNIAICDDNEALFSRIEEVIEEHLGVDVVCDFYSESADFLAHFRDGQRYDAYLLDICMPGSSGMALAAEIRQSDQQAILIFVSGYENYGCECIDYAPLCFIKKKNFEKDLAKAMVMISKKLADKAQRIAFKKGRRTILLAYDEIHYIQGKRNNYSVFTKDGEYDFYGTLSQLEKTLPENIFARINKSNIVNVFHIREIAPQSIKVDGCDFSIPVNEKGWEKINRIIGQSVREKHLL